MRLAWLVRSAAARETSAPLRPEATSWNWRWPLSFRNQKRMSGMSARLAPMASRTWSWVSLRLSLGTRLMMSVALRTSAPEPMIRPPLMNTLRTSGRSRTLAAIASVTARVSAMSEPGGSSTASSRRLLSSAGRKPAGSR